MSPFGYTELMLTNLHIQRFRGINELCLKDASRVNLIVGRNDAGKTSLLEAIRFMLAGHPRNLRRPGRNRVEPKRTSRLTQVKIAFYDSQTGGKIEVSGIVNERQLNVTAEISSVLPNQEDGTQSLVREIDDDDSESLEDLLSTNDEVIVKISVDGKLITTISQLLDDKFRMNGYHMPNPNKYVWLGTDRAEVWDHARHYSSLYRSGGSDMLITILREIEPRLKQLVVLTEKDDTHSSSAVLEVDLGLSETLPLSSMGDGFGSVIAMLSAIGSAKNGLCLIDEIENGIHYSIQEQVWSSLALGAEKFDTQIWATTHSYDCLSSIHRAFEDRPEDLRVHRLERKHDGFIAVHTFNYAVLGRALESGLEVR